VLHVKSKEFPALCGQTTHCKKSKWLCVLVWLLQLLNTKRMDGDPGKGERKLTVMNVGTVFLLALECICRESEVTLFAMVFLTATMFLSFHREVPTSLFEIYQHFPFILYPTTELNNYNTVFCCGCVDLCGVLILLCWQFGHFEDCRIKGKVYTSQQIFVLCVSTG